MALSAVFLSPPGQPVVTVNGRSYVVTGTTITIPFPDAANVQLPLLQVQGATSDRPSWDANGAGYFGVATGGVPGRMFDTTLGAMIFNSNPGHGPTVWINAAGSAV